jgi:hypothetical protein
MAPVVDTSMCLKKGLKLIPKLIEILNVRAPIQDLKILYNIEVLSCQSQLVNEDGICFTLTMGNG